MSTNSSDATAGTDAQAAEYNNLRKDLTTGRGLDVVTATDGATVTFDLDSGNVQEVTLGGNRTLALSNDADGHKFMIILTQDGTGSRTVTWWSNIEWQDGNVPTLATAAGDSDVFGFLRVSSTRYLGFVVSQRMS